MSADVLADAVWECGSAPAGSVADPRQLGEASIEWLPATVPGTAAAALRDAGAWRWGMEDRDVLDGRDWWFRCSFDAPRPAPRWELRLGGLATLADVWLNGRHLLHSENMFVNHRVEVELAHVGDNELAIRLAALDPVLERRHPRPRWKSRLVRSQSLRWYRTTILGRVPGWSRWAAPVGPWRPVGLRAIGPGVELLERRLQVSCEGAGGVVSVQLRLRCTDVSPAVLRLRVGDDAAALEHELAGTELLASGTVRLDQVERWWPHTHGDQPRYPVTLELDGTELSLGSVGFRTVELERADGAFTLRVNGAATFCRGACWGAPDGVSLAAGAEQVRDSLLMARDAGMNMLRVAGYTWYEDEVFWEACDELGILVWQDCMLASVDPPEDADFVDGIEHELRQVLGLAQGRPALGVVCGSSETYQQAAMLGLPPDRWRSSLLEQSIPALVADVLPGVPYVPSSPSGGVLPFDVDSGVAHYFGVGAYMRPLKDARLANVRFAAECLSFGTPPESETVNEVFGDARAAGHDPRWKASVARDAGTSWDFEDIREHYVREIFGVDPFAIRYCDPELALDLGRAAVAEAMAVVLADWRRRDSSCAGAIVLTMRDLWPGAGWGLLDSFGRPKASWYAFARVFAPRTVLITDDGLSGLCLHVFNDRCSPFVGVLRLTVFGVSGTTVESAEQRVEIPANGCLAIRTPELLGGFRDLTAAYRFGPSPYDAVHAELEDEHGAWIGDAIHLPGGAGRPRLPELGLEAALEPGAHGAWSLRVSSRLLAQYVALDIPGFVASDSWFHLAPGSSRTVMLRSSDPERLPAGTVRALNSSTGVRVDARRVAQ
ncbi:MAG: glycosyl hydrolase 2 galactose-binding domain-containing protein [Solirubrobacteraceae bacterium]